MGYALFLAINATGVWGGVFPFLPIEFQTHDIILAFFLAQALVFAASHLASALAAYYFPRLTRILLAQVAAVPYAVGWCCLICAIYLEQWALPLVVAGGTLIGAGSTGFYMLWQRLFASQEPETGMRNLLLGSGYAAVAYFSLYLIPQAVTTLLIPLVFLPLFGLCAIVKSRGIRWNQPMFEDVPREHPQVYAHVLRTYWRSALSVGVLGLCTGVMRALAVTEPQTGSLVNVMSMAGLLIAALLLLVVWERRGMRLNVDTIYRTLFPFIITAFLLLPFMPEPYARWLAAILYAGYSAALMLMMAQCAQISRDGGINPVFVFGFFGAVIYFLHDLGFVAGMLAENVQVLNVTPLAVVALVAVWLLGLMHFTSMGGMRQALHGDTGAGPGGSAGSRAAAGDIEFVAPAAAAATVTPPPAPASVAAPVGAAAPVPASAPTPARPKAGTLPPENGNRSPQGPFPDAESPDHLSAQVQLLRAHYRLSARESEIVELVVHGNTVARIAEMLVVSENTVRTHTKRIYAKLGIHKKQELVDLVGLFGDSR